MASVLPKVSVPSVAATVMPPEPSVSVGLPANVNAPGSVLNTSPVAAIAVVSVTLPPLPPA